MLYSPSLWGFPEVFSLKVIVSEGVAGLLESHGKRHTGLIYINEFEFMVWVAFIAFGYENPWDT